MSTTVTLSTAILCEYKTGTLGPYTLLNGHSRVTGKIYWTYKNNKISFYFKCTNREVQTYLDTTARVYKFFGSPAGYIRLGVNGSYTDYRFAVKQSSAGGIAGGSGWIEWDGTYDSTATKTINATTSTVTLVIGFKASSEETKSVSFTPSKTTMVSTVPKVEYYRDGINVKARVICVTTRSSTTYSDSYTYVAKITVSGSSQQVTLSIPSTNTSATSTSSWVTVASTANSLTASVSISSTNGGAYSATRSTTMNVPAMSTISGEATGTLGTDYIINITRYNADFTDTLSYYINGTLVDTIASGLTGSTDSYTWSTPPISLAEYATTGTSVAVTIRCTTTSEGTTVGSTDKTVTYAIPSSVVPTLGTITLTKINSNTTVAGWDIFLQNYSQCGISISGSAGVYDSTITGYSVKVDNVVINGTMTNDNADWSGTSTTLVNAGAITVSVSCTDSRGRSASSTQTIQVYEYSNPTISNSVCYRSDSGNNNTELDDGTYIYAYAKAIYSSANSHNSATMTLKYRSSSSSSYTTGGTLASETGTKFGGGNISVSSPWEVVIDIADILGNSNSYIFQLPTGMATIHVRPGGTGICIGGYSQNDNSFALADDIALLTGNAVIRSSLPATGIDGQIVLLLTTDATSTFLIPYVYTNSSWICTLLSSYPIGSIYMSTSSTSPASLFGGYWNQIQGRFLIGVGENEANTTDYWGSFAASSVNMPAGEMGGEAKHTLTTGEMASHTHGSKSLSGHVRFRKVGSAPSALAGAGSGIMSLADNNDSKYQSVTQYDSTTRTSQQLTVNATHEHTSVGSNTAHNNMPPYLVVYMWERVEPPQD